MLKDAFNKIRDRQDEVFIQEIVSHFHYRNGLEHPDGSLGEIKISPKQLRDALAYVNIYF
jgi:hypothetical protein